MLHWVCKGIQSAQGNALQPDNTSATLSLSLSRQSASLLIMFAACLNFPFITYLCGEKLLVYISRIPATVCAGAVFHSDLWKSFTVHLTVISLPSYFSLSISFYGCFALLFWFNLQSSVFMSSRSPSTVWPDRDGEIFSPGTVVVLNVILQKLYDWCCLNRLILPHSGKSD